MDEIKSFKIIPKRYQITGVIKSLKNDENFGNLRICRKYQNNNNEINQLSLPNDGLKDSSPSLVLKRSSLIKYDEVIPFADASEEQSRRMKEDDASRNDKQPHFSLFKTGSISSLKISSLKEQWPSSEYVQSSRCKMRTQSTCDEHRVPLSSTASNGNVCDLHLNAEQHPTIPISKDPPLSLNSDKSALAACLSKCDVNSKAASTNIMQTIDFTEMSLVESLQHFIKKIPVIGESQERDRILTYFTDRYMVCNPTAFKNNDSCHTLVCALMLLNTDIHGQVSKKRMTCKEFVDNILSNYPDNDYKENDLISVYSFIRKTELKNEDSAADSSRTLRRKITKLITKSIRPPQEVTSINIDANLLNQQHFISGNIMRKCIKRSFGKKPALGHRGWKLQFASLIGLQLLLFKTNLNKNDGRQNQDDFNGDRISLTDSNISSELLQNDNSSLSFSVNNTTKSINSKLPSSCSRDNIQVSVDDVETCIKIHHAFATVVEKLRHKNVFSLRLADQAEYFFKVKRDQLHTWVNSINYAAAILSAPPIVGAGQSGLYKPLLPGYITDLSRLKQMQSHEAQIVSYRESLKKLQLVNNKARSMNEPHIQFCKYEILRFESYLKVLMSQSIDEGRSDQSSTCPDINSILSITEPHFPNYPMDISQSPRSAFNTYQSSADTSIQDMTTLRRRPPKVPNVSYSNSITRAASSSSNKMYEPVPIQLSPTADSLHSCAMPQYYIPIQKRPIPYSPQIGSHVQFIHSPGVRPIPSFSRFIDPSLNSFEHCPKILSPLTTTRMQHSCQQQSFVEVAPVNKLPQYSPPSSRHNINKT